MLRQQFRSRAAVIDRFSGALAWRLWGGEPGSRVFADCEGAKRSLTAHEKPHCGNHGGGWTLANEPAALAERFRH